NVQAVLGNVDTDNDGVHLFPSLSKRARWAALATVRVRWNDGRRPTLGYGIHSPRMTRYSARHPPRNSIGFGSRQVTRMTAGEKAMPCPKSKTAKHAPRGSTPSQQERNR